MRPSSLSGEPYPPAPPIPETRTAWLEAYRAKHPNYKWHTAGDRQSMSWWDPDTRRTVVIVEPKPYPRVPEELEEPAQTCDLHGTSSDDYPDGCPACVEVAP